MPEACTSSRYTFLYNYQSLFHLYRLIFFKILINIPDILFYIYSMNISEVYFSLTYYIHELMVFGTADSIRKEIDIIRFVNNRSLRTLRRNLSTSSINTDSSCLQPSVPACSVKSITCLSVLIFSKFPVLICISSGWLEKTLRITTPSFLEVLS